jgi:hypothetical protein
VLDPYGGAPTCERCYQPPPRGVVSSEPVRPRGPYFCGVWTDDGTHYFPVQHGAEPAKVITFDGPEAIAECIARALRKPTSLDLEFSDQPPGVFGANKQRVPVVSIDGARLALPSEPQDLAEALAAVVGAPRVCGPYTIRGRGCLGDPTGGALFGEHMTREAMRAWLDARDDGGTFEIIDESDGSEACGYDTGTCGGAFACDCGRSDCPDTEPDAIFRTAERLYVVEPTSRRGREALKQPAVLAAKSVAEDLVRDLRAAGLVVSVRTT